MNIFSTLLGLAAKLPGSGSSPAAATVPRNRPGQHAGDAKDADSTPLRATRLSFNDAGPDVESSHAGNGGGAISPTYPIRGFDGGDNDSSEDEAFYDAPEVPDVIPPPLPSAAAAADAAALAKAQQRLFALALKAARAAEAKNAFPDAVYRTQAIDEGSFAAIPLISGAAAVLQEGAKGKKLVVSEQVLERHAGSKEVAIDALTMLLASSASIPELAKDTFDTAPAEAEAKEEGGKTAYKPVPAPLSKNVVTLNQPGCHAWMVRVCAPGKTSVSDEHAIGKEAVQRSFEEEVQLIELAAAVSYLRVNVGVDAAIALLCSPAHRTLLHSRAVGPLTLNALLQRALGSKRYAAWKEKVVAAFTAEKSTPLSYWDGMVGRYGLQLQAVTTAEGDPELLVISRLQVRWVLFSASGCKVHRYRCGKFDATWEADRLLPVLADYGSAGAECYAEHVKTKGHLESARLAAKACAVQVHVAISPEMRPALRQDAEPCKHCCRFYSM